jgi:Ca2+-binding EF-hand superfamily protein
LKLLANFESLDLKKSGKIRLTNLQAMFSNCGFELNEEELEIAKIELDLSGDGKIKYNDLRKWWFCGHRRSTGIKGNVI